MDVGGGISIGAAATVLTVLDVVGSKRTNGTQLKASPEWSRVGCSVRPNEIVVRTSASRGKPQLGRVLR